MRYVALLRQPPILRLWLGQLASTAGDRLYAMAVLWLTLEMTGSAKLMAGVALLELLPHLLVGLVGGVLIDRFHRFRLMISLDLIRAALLLVLPTLHLLGALHPVHLAVVALVLGGLDALFAPALETVLPGLVDPPDLPALVGLVDTTSRFARIIGPGLAGPLLMLLPPVHFFTLDAFSFLLSALCLTGVAGRVASAEPSERSRQRTGTELGAGRRMASAEPPGQAPGQARGRMRTELSAGWRVAFGHRSLLIPMLIDGVNNLLWAAFTLGAPLLTSIRLQSSLGGYGLLIGAYGVGSLLGNGLAGNAIETGRLLPWRLGGWIGVGAGFLLLGFAPTLPLAMSATALAGVGGSIAHVARSASISLQVPDHHLGKVHSLQKMVENLSLGLGLAFAGGLLGSMPPHRAIGGAGLGMILAALAGMLLLGRKPIHRWEGPIA